MERKTHTIDAANRILGRLATEIAILLRGKNKTDFAPNKEILCLLRILKKSK